MLLELYGILLLTAFVLVALGFYTKTPALSTIGFLFSFLLSFTLMANGLTHEIGYNQTALPGNVSETIYSYGSYSDSTNIYGIYLAILSASGLAIVLAQSMKWGDK